MKRLISLSAILMLVGGLSYAATIPTPDGVYMIKRQIGARAGVPVRVVKLVRHSSADPDTATINSGEAVVWDTNSADGVSVRVSSTRADGAAAGIAVTDILTSDASTAASASDDEDGRNWGYIVVHGFALAEVGGTTDSGGVGAVAGALMIISSDSTKVSTPSSTTFTADAAGAFGFFLQTPTSSTTQAVFVTAE